jgi:hypothetical protein
VVFSNGLAHGPGTAVDHEPKGAKFVRLELNEVITPAQSGELNSAIPVFLFFQPTIAQFRKSQVLRQPIQHGAP